MSTYKDYLNKIWYDPKNPVGFTGLKALRRFIIKNNTVYGEKWFQKSLLKKLKSQELIISGMAISWTCLILKSIIIMLLSS